jgi:hypothetical protein
MAAGATRDLLSTTSLLFDKSEEVFEETKKLAKCIGSRAAFAGSAELQRLVAAGLDSSSLQTLSEKIPNTSAAGLGSASGASAAAELPVLAAVLAECSAAAASIAALQLDRDAVVTARREAIAQREAAMGLKREALKEELSAVCE